MFMTSEYNLAKSKGVVEADLERMCSIFRVGKCHGYDGYIRVKKLASWGKKFGRLK